MKKNYLSAIKAISIVSLFFMGMEVAFAGVVQDYLGQNLLVFESQYRDQVSGQTNSPQANYRTELVNSLDALVACLYQTNTTSTPNWQFGGITVDMPTTTLTQKLAGTPMHPCQSQYNALTTLRTRADADPNGKYPALIIADRAPVVTAWRVPTSGTPAYDTNISTPTGRDQVARQKLNQFSDCLMRSTTDQAIVQSLRSANRTELRAAINSNQAHPCHAALVATENARPGGISVAPANNSSAGSAQNAILPNQEAGITNNPNAGTVFTGPGFVNVTPFSVFGKVSVDRIINNVINYISGFLAIIAVLSIMYAGVLYMTAGGDNGKIGKAKQLIALTGMGIVLASFSYIAVVFVTRIFYGS